MWEGSRHVMCWLPEEIHRPTRMCELLRLCILHNYLISTRHLNIFKVFIKLDQIILLGFALPCCRGRSFGFSCSTDTYFMIFGFSFNQFGSSRYRHFWILERGAILFLVISWLICCRSFSVYSNCWCFYSSTEDTAVYLKIALLAYIYLSFIVCIGPSNKKVTLYILKIHLVLSTVSSRSQFWRQKIPHLATPISFHVTNGLTCVVK